MLRPRAKMLRLMLRPQRQNGLVFTDIVATLRLPRGISRSHSHSYSFRFNDLTFLTFQPAKAIRAYPRYELSLNQKSKFKIQKFHPTSSYFDLLRATSSKFNLQPWPLHSSTIPEGSRKATEASGRLRKVGRGGDIAPCRYHPTVQQHFAKDPWGRLRSTFPPDKVCAGG